RLQEMALGIISSLYETGSGARFGRVEAVYVLGTIRKKAGAVPALVSMGGTRLCMQGTFACSSCQCGSKGVHSPVSMDVHVFNGSDKTGQVGRLPFCPAVLAAMVNGRRMQSDTKVWWHRHTHVLCAGLTLYLSTLTGAGGFA